MVIQHLTFNISTVLETTYFHNIPDISTDVETDIFYIVYQGMTDLEDVISTSVVG
ncbi:hypothetical protein AAZX31_15G196500 [Glycine max]